MSRGGASRVPFRGLLLFGALTLWSSSAFQVTLPLSPAVGLSLAPDGSLPATGRTSSSRSRLFSTVLGRELVELRELNKQIADVEGVRIMDVSRQDLREAAGVCVEAFFGESRGANPVRTMQLSTLVDEQLDDLKSRWAMGARAKMLKAVDEETGAMLGFVEISAAPGNKYGFGSEQLIKPYLASLAVRSAARRRGIGRALALACEELARSWSYNEVLLQVEEDNVAARNLYKGLGYDEFFSNRGGRRYDLSTFSIRSVPVTKVYMRKMLKQRSAMEKLWGYVQSSFTALQDDS